MGNEERERLIQKRHSKAKKAAVAAALAHQHTQVGGRMGRVGLHHPDQQPGQEVEGEMITTAEAVRTGTVAGGVDLFLPPSTYAIPMTLNGGRPYPAVAFTTVPYQQGVMNPPQDDGKPKAKAAKSKNARKFPANAPPPRHHDNYRFETDLQKLWRIEKERVVQTFNKVYRDLAKETSTAKYRFTLAESESSKDPMIDYRARLVMDSVVEDVKDIATAMHKAGANAMLYFGGDMEKSNVVDQVAENGLTSRDEDNDSDPPMEDDQKDNSGEASIAKEAIAAASCDVSGADQTNATLTTSNDEAATSTLMKRRIEASEESPGDNMDVDAFDAGVPTEKSSSQDPRESEQDDILDDSMLLCDENIEDLDSPAVDVATEKPPGLEERNEPAEVPPATAPVDELDESSLLCEENIGSSATAPDDEVDASSLLCEENNGSSATAPVSSSLLCEENIGSSATALVDELDASSLLCDENIGSSEDRELTEDAVRELTVLAAQEAALLRQLAGIIRIKTLEMTQRRLQLVEDVRSKG